MSLVVGVGLVAGSVFLCVVEVGIEVVVPDRLVCFT